jgi:predicted small secreted protein
MKRAVPAILAIALSGALLAACDNAGQAPSGAGGTADRSTTTDPDRTKRATPGAPTSPTAPGGAAGSGSTSGSSNK